MFNRISTQTGLVKTIIVIIVALLILSYFGFNLRSLINSPTTQDNFSYVKNFTVKVWNNYLKRPATYLWNDIFIKLIWKPAIHALENINSGDGTEALMQDRAPTIPTPDRAAN